MIEAARRLFDARGVRKVSLGDIADAVGLRRTSLYRYFPTKAHIVQRWFDLTMTPLIEASRAVIEEPGTPADRLGRWLEVQLGFMTDEEHAALVAVSSDLDELPPEVRDQIGSKHRELYATLVPLLPGAAELVRTRIVLVAGLVRSSAELIGAGMAPELVRAELLRAACAIVDLERD